MSDDHIMVETAALKSDASAWQCVGSAEQSLSLALADLSISQADLHPRADLRTTARGSYVSFLETAQRVLSDAGKAATGASQALLEIRDDYAKSESEADNTAMDLLARIHAGKPALR